MSESIHSNILDMMYTLHIQIERKIPNPEKELTLHQTAWMLSLTSRAQSGQGKDH